MVSLASYSLSRTISGSYRLPSMRRSNFYVNHHTNPALRALRYQNHTPQYSQRSTNHLWVRIVDSSARDGIQAIEDFVPTSVKIRLVNKIADAGIGDIDVTSITKTVQMGDAKEVYNGVVKFPHTRLWILTPNMYGFEKAVSWGCRHAGLICSSSEAFSMANTRMGIEEAFQERHLPVIDLARRCDVTVRAYLSCVFGFESPDDVNEEETLKLIERFYSCGNHVNVIICDTTNLATPERVSSLFRKIFERGMHPDRFGIHFHGQGQEVLDKIEAALEQGVREVDTSLEGLGGCPEAKLHLAKDLSNAPTERVVERLHEKGYETGVDLQKLYEAQRYISEELRNLNPNILQDL